nr:MAG TPA: hypothetical protein [Caudoviricetes sp.]
MQPKKHVFLVAFKVRLHNSVARKSTINTSNHDECNQCNQKILNEIYR